MIIYKISEYGYLLSKELQSYNDVVLFANFNLKFLTKALRCETECCFFNTFGAAYFLSGFNGMMQQMHVLTRITPRDFTLG